MSDVKDVALKYPHATGEYSRNTSSIIFSINEYIAGKYTESTAYRDPLSSAGSNALSRIGDPNTLLTGVKKTANKIGISDKFIKETLPDTIDGSIFPQNKRLLQKIQLHMPSNLTTSYGAEYGEIAIGGLTGTVLDNLSKSETVKAASDLGSGAVRKGLSSIVSAGLGVAGSSISYSDAMAGINKAFRTIENPRKEMVFGGIKIRSFQFTFMFAPRSQGESETVFKIIEEFKLNMHPELAKQGENSSYITYPNDFDIDFMHVNNNNKLVVNEAINKINTCFLEGMQVDYATNGIWSTFHNGHPTNIALTLSFREFEPLMRDHIVKGF
jgi:hypothetical protein